jgi:hypothetical protein
MLHWPSKHVLDLVLCHAVPADVRYLGLGIHVVADVHIERLSSFAAKAN